MQAFRLVASPIGTRLSIEQVAGMAARKGADQYGDRQLSVKSRFIVNL